LLILSSLIRKVDFVVPPTNDAAHEAPGEARATVGALCNSAPVKCELLVGDRCEQNVTSHVD
jgi:hypothetical protein